jgi:hypothetical protein
VRIGLLTVVLVVALWTVAHRPTAAAYPWSVPLQISDPITISNANGVVIENVRLANPSGSCILVQNSHNAIIRNSALAPVGIRRSARTEVRTSPC